MPPKLNVHNFPRPPLLEKTSRHLQIRWNNQLIADTKDAYWVLETTHPPSTAPAILSPTLPYLALHLLKMSSEAGSDKHPIAYYLPPNSLLLPLIRSSHQSYCEWKGAATYWNIANPGDGSDVVKNRIWSYGKPTKGFSPIKDYLSFYAGPWDCFVDGEKVEAQPGDFYGGWMTSDIEGPVKGGPGTWGW
ncbi:MAG: hypothetical protein LQ341_002362 [Variospora aurantia]|nr:MAG: hypothetical protein LQ341_002362 [Variospora aurantia]